MDMNGRLHMPGFVGESFEETGVLSELTAPVDERRPGENRQQRRAREAMERKLTSKLTKGERA